MLHQQALSGAVDGSNAAPISVPRLGFNYLVTLVGSSGDVVDGRLFPSQQATSSKVVIPGLPVLEIPAFIQDFLDVAVSYAVSPQRMYVQLRNEADTILKISDLLGQYISKGNYSPLVNPIRGQICAAKYSLDEQFYRAAVIQRPTVREVEVFFVDYGNTETINKDDIVPLPAELLEYPPQAVAVKLRPVGGAVNEQRFRELGDKLEECEAYIQLLGCPENSLYVVRMVVLDLSYGEHDVVLMLNSSRPFPELRPRSAPQPPPVVQQQEQPDQQIQGQQQQNRPSNSMEQSSERQQVGRSFGDNFLAKSGGFSSGQLQNGYSDRAAFGGSSNRSQQHSNRFTDSEQPSRGFGQYAGSGGGFQSQSSFRSQNDGGGNFSSERPGSFARQGGGGGPKCFNCQQEGHISRQCPNPRAERTDNYPPSSRPMKCFNCGGGHRAMDCPNKNAASASDDTDSDRRFRRSQANGFGDGGSRTDGFFSSASANPASLGQTNEAGQKPSGLGAFSGGGSFSSAMDKPAAEQHQKPAAEQQQPEVLSEGSIGELPRSVDLRRSDGDSSDPNRFYCQLADWGEVVDKVTDEIKPGEKPLEELTVNAACVAEYLEMWYRAEVETVAPIGTICTLRFVDFGNIASRNKSEVFSIKEQNNFVRTQHKFSIPCRIRNLVSTAADGTYGEDAKEKFATLSSEHAKLTTEVQYRDTDGVYVLKVVAQDSLFKDAVEANEAEEIEAEEAYCVIEKFVESGFAKIQPTIPVRYPEIAASDLIGQSLAVTRSDGGFCDAPMFCGQLHERFARELDELNGLKPGRAPLERMQIGDGGIALFENVWFRCQVLEVGSEEKDGQLLVRFVDWGNEEWMEKNDVFELGSDQPPSALTTPATAIQIRIGLETLEKEKFQEIVEVEREFTVELSDENLSEGYFLAVKLTDADGADVMEKVSAAAMDQRLASPSADVYVDCAQQEAELNANIGKRTSDEDATIDEKSDEAENLTNSSASNTVADGGKTAYEDVDVEELLADVTLDEQTDSDKADHLKVED